MELYVQLYSVRQDCQTDFVGTLGKLKAMGYAGVEFAGYHGMDIGELKQTLDTLGLKAISGHVGLPKLIDNLDEEIANLKALGAQFIVCPNSTIKTASETIALAKELNAIGKVCKAAGLPLLYHNHTHELVSDNGQTLLEILFDHVHPDDVQQELDIYWLAYAGFDVYSYLDKYRDRNKLVHLKQLAITPEKKNVEAGNGVLDFERVIHLLPNTTFIYEQEAFAGDQMDEMARSCRAILKG